MKAFGELLKRISPLWTALGFLAMAVGAAFLAGASTSSLLEKPAQVDMNTEVNLIQDSVNTAQDTAIANIKARQSVTHGEMAEQFERVFCFLRLVVAEERPIPAMACEPEGADPSNLNGGSNEQDREQETPG